MNKCDMCIHNEVCDHNRFGFENCNNFKDKSLVVELPCRCKDCEYAREIKLEQDTIYKCIAEIPHRLVTADDFCQYAELKLKESEETE